MERLVQCVAADGQESHGCSQDNKPEARNVCRNPNCEYCDSQKKPCCFKKLPGLQRGQKNCSIRCGVMWSGHPRERASGEIFMFIGKHQRLSSVCASLHWDGTSNRQWLFFVFDLMQQFAALDLTPEIFCACMHMCLCTAWVLALC